MAWRSWKGASTGTTVPALGLGRVAGGAGQRGHGIAQRVAPGRQQLVADAVAGVARVGVGGVVDPPMAGIGEFVPQHLARYRQQGPAEAHAVTIEAFGHGRQAWQAGTPAQRQQHGLGLVILVMRGQQQRDAMFLAEFTERTVAGQPCSLLDAEFGYVRQRDPRRIECHAQCRRVAFAMRQPVVRIRAEAVVYMEGKQLPAVAPAVISQQPQQQRRIEPAAVGDRDRAVR